MTQSPHQLRATRPTAIRVTGYWNVFLDGHVAEDTYGTQLHRSTDALTDHANTVIRDVTNTHQVTYVDLYTPFHGTTGDDDDTALLAAGRHPSQPSWPPGDRRRATPRRLRPTTHQTLNDGGHAWEKATP